MRYKSVFLELIVLACLQLAAQGLPAYSLAETESGFSYSVVGEIAILTGYEGNEAQVSIPEKLGGVPVAAVGEEALAGLSADSVSLPRSVHVLCSGAFRGAKMQEVRFSYGLTDICEEAFEGCANLTGAALPETLISLAGGAFRGCHSLLFVTIPESVRIEEDPFPDCPLLATLAMISDHPSLMMAGNKLISRKDSRVLSVLSALSPEDAHD